MARRGPAGRPLGASSTGVAGPVSGESLVSLQSLQTPAPRQSSPDLYLLTTGDPTQVLGVKCLRAPERVPVRNPPTGGEGRLNIVEENYKSQM